MDGLFFNSIQNWIQDLFWKQLDLGYPDTPDAMVGSSIYAFEDVLIVK